MDTSIDMHENKAKDIKIGLRLKNRPLTSTWPLVQDGQWLSTWLQVAEQSIDICMAFSGNTCHRHQHNPRLRDYGPRHGPWWQHGPQTKTWLLHDLRQSTMNTKITCKGNIEQRSFEEVQSRKWIISDTLLLLRTKEFMHLGHHVQGLNLHKFQTATHHPVSPSSKDISVPTPSTVALSHTCHCSCIFNSTSFLLAYTT